MTLRTLQKKRITHWSTVKHDCIIFPFTAMTTIVIPKLYMNPQRKDFMVQITPFALEHTFLITQ